MTSVAESATATTDSVHHQPRRWMCLICGWIYDDSVGDPDSNILPGTSWEDIPDDWQCPECGVTKDEFEMVEI